MSSYGSNSGSGGSSSGGEGGSSEPDDGVPSDTPIDEENDYI